MSAFIKPLRFRFTAAEDVALYGDRWWVYDESAWAELPARRLMALEQAIGAPLVEVMAGVRASSAFGDMAAAWLAMTLDPETLVGAYATFNPHTMLMEWDSVPEGEPAVEAPKAETLPAMESVDRAMRDSHQASASIMGMVKSVEIPLSWERQVDAEEMLAAERQRRQMAETPMEPPRPDWWQGSAAAGSVDPGTSTTDTVSLGTMPQAGSNPS